MKYLFIGDYNSNTGPANVNKNLKSYLKTDFKFIHKKSLFLKEIETVYKIITSQKICMSGYSKSFFFYAILAKILNKKTVILVHGSATYENKINEVDNKWDSIFEKKIFENVNKILCVSENYMLWFKKEYPLLKTKTSYLNNGIEWDKLPLETSLKRKEKNDLYFTIVTMGGGKPQKKNLQLCKAVEIYNWHNSKKIKLIVLGSFGSDLDKISDYYFVECPGQVSHEEAYRYLKSADLFVQNSILESFNLATVEALISGCSILISKNVGAISILNGIQNQDIIFDNDDLEELTEKIKINLNSSNNERILNSIDRNSTSYKFASTRLIKIIEEVS